MYLYCSCRTVFIGGNEYTTSAFSVSYFRCMCRLTKQQKMKTQKSWLRISLENWRNTMSRHCQFGSNLETSVLRNTSGFMRYKSSKCFFCVVGKMVFLYCFINIIDSAQDLFNQETAEQWTHLRSEIALMLSIHCLCHKLQNVARKLFLSMPG